MLAKEKMKDDQQMSRELNFAITNINERKIYNTTTNSVDLKKNISLRKRNS